MKPYKGNYYLAGPVGPDDVPYFQPGFEYLFVECCCDYPQPANYNDNTFSWYATTIKYVTPTESDYGTIFHPNHSAISIKEVNDALGASQVKKCYDNNNRAPNGGKVTRFNDNVFNTNVTVTPKDSTSINHQMLIQDLTTGLYLIEKHYPDGASEETVIYKENND